MDQTGERPLKFVREAAERWVRSHDAGFYHMWKGRLVEHLKECAWGYEHKEWGPVKEVWMENKVEFEEVVRACQTIQKLKGKKSS